MDTSLPVGGLSERDVRGTMGETERPGCRVANLVAQIAQDNSEEVLVQLRWSFGKYRNSMEGGPANGKAFQASPGC